MGEEEMRDLVRFMARREDRDRGRAWLSRLQERGAGVLSQSSELGQSRLQLSLCQRHITEGIIVICNYVVFCEASVWCAPTLRLFLAREY